MPCSPTTSSANPRKAPPNSKPTKDVWKLNYNISGSEG